MSLRSKIIAVMTIPFVVLIALMSATLVARTNANDAIAAERRAVSLRNALGRVLVDLNGAGDGMSGYLLTGQPEFLTEYLLTQTAFSNDMHSLAAVERGSVGGKRILDELQALADERFAILSSAQYKAPITNLTNHRDLVAGMKLGERVMDQIRVLIGDSENEASNRVAARQRGVDTSRRIAFLIAVVGTPIGILASILVALVFMQRLVRRIQRTEENARRLEEGVPLQPASPSEDELGRLERRLVSSGSRVVELQTELRRQATVDPLTRLTNRRGFLPMAEHQLAAAKRTHQPLALLFADLDGLKWVNDTLGHAIGDGMITEASYVLRRTFRASDLIARMGGDEFCVLMTAGSAAAEASVSRMQAVIAEINTQEERPFALSFSTGLALFDPEQPCSLDALIAEADGRMYAAKRAKRNAKVEPVA